MSEEFGGGALLDRYRPNWIGGLTLGAAMFAFVLLMNGVRSPALIVVALIVNDYAAGAKTQITGFLTASYGGLMIIGLPGYPTWEKKEPAAAFA